MLSADEFLVLSFSTTKHGQAVFALADRDMDERLTPEEFVSRPISFSLTEEHKATQTRALVAYITMDLDGDDRVVLDELLSDGRRLHLGDTIAEWLL